MLSGIRPLWREWLIVFYRWAQHDLQRKDPTHEDLPLIVLRLRHLLDERAADHPSIAVRFVRWL